MLKGFMLRRHILNCPHVVRTHAETTHAEKTRVERIHVERHMEDRLGA